jgi:hypothetical protein
MMRASPNPLPKQSMIIAPAKGHSYSPWHQIDTVMLNKFDALCVEKKLLDPTFPRADKKRS